MSTEYLSLSAHKRSLIIKPKALHLPPSPPVFCHLHLYSVISLHRVSSSNQHYFVISVHEKKRDISDLIM